MSKGIEAFNNILAEGDFRYFSSLYDRDMFKEDIIAVKKELKVLEIIKNEWRLSFYDEEQLIFIDDCYSVTFYNKKEYDLLKEVLK